MNRVRQVEHHLRERLPTVHVERRGEVGIIWLARQARYGAMSCGLHRDVRRDILLSLQGLQKDDGCTSILIASDRRNVFSTGINRRDFDDGVFDGFDAAGRVVPSVATLCSAISSSPKLVVVLLGGLCQSWGLELALAAHYRIGMANCRLSFPEVLLGTVPCGGTLPRLIAKIGVPETVSMVVYGKVMHAQRAHELQVLDWVLTPPPQLDTTATAAAASIMSQAVEMVLKWNSNGGVAKWAASQPAPMLISTLFHRSQLAWERHKLLTIVPYRMKAPYLAADAVGLALAHGLNPSAAQREEQKNQFLQCVHGLEGVGAQHVMRATTNIWYHLDQTPPPTQIPRLLSGGAPFPHVVIIGGGAVGASLVLHILRYVPQVSVVEANEVRRRNLMSYLEVCIQERYALTEGRDAIRDFLLSRLRVVGGAQSPLNSSVFRTASLVIECTSEGNADVKRNNIARIDRLCPPNCLFVVCSGAPDLHAIATATSRPSKVMALILYSPVDVVPMVELMTTDETCGLALHQVLCFLGDVHKNVVVTKAVKGKLRGAVSTRLLLSAMFQAYAMLEDGCFPFDIDSILQRTLHFRFGIFALADQLGLDVLSAFRVTMRESQRQRQQDDPSYNFTSREVFDVEESLVRHGKLGKKAGEGWYKYSPLGSLDPVSFDHDDNASGKATIDDELSNFTIQKLKSSHNRDVEMCALRWSKHKHIKRRDMSRKEITERILLAMLQEAAMMIEEGQVSSSADIDVISVLLLGFPVTKGGICYYADHLFPGGLKRIVYEMRIYNEAFGNHVFPPPCAALLRMAAEERTFESSGAKQIP